MYKILRRKQLNDTVVRLDVEAPFIAKKAKAGQFIILRIDERGERMPLTIADTNAEEGSVSIIFQIVGQTTMLLSQMKEGDFLFIIDDSTVYHTLNDFRSTPARAAYQQVMQKQKDYDMLSKNLEEKREQYAQSNRSQKKALAPGILDLEKRTEQLLKEIEKLTLNVRNEEIKKLKH